MLYKKKGFPAEEEIVLCTVKKILHNSIFVSLDEYQNIEGMIHISEIAAGRIRNIRDYVKEGKTIICKVLRSREETKHVDLSLRRVSNVTRIQKLKEFKYETKSEKLLEFMGKQAKLSLDQVYEKIGEKLIEQYGTLYKGFQEILKNEKILAELKIEKKLAAVLLKLIKEHVKLPEISLKARLTLRDFAENGIDHIKSIFKKTLKHIKENNYKAEFTYISAPEYQLEITAPDYKFGEKILKEISEKVIAELKSLGGVGEWQKIS